MTSVHAVHRSARGAHRAPQAGPLPPLKLRATLARGQPVGYNRRVEVGAEPAEGVSRAADHAELPAS